MDPTRRVLPGIGVFLLLVPGGSHLLVMLASKCLILPGAMHASRLTRCNNDSPYFPSATLPWVLQPIGRSSCDADQPDACASSRSSCLVLSLSWVRSLHHLPDVIHALQDDSCEMFLHHLHTHLAAARANRSRALQSGFPSMGKPPIPSVICWGPCIVPEPLARHIAPGPIARHAGMKA